MWLGKSMNNVCVWDVPLTIKGKRQVAICFKAIRICVNVPSCIIFVTDGRQLWPIILQVVDWSLFYWCQYLNAYHLPWKCMTPWQFHCTSLCQEKPRTADADEARQGVQWKVTVERWQSSILGCKCFRFFWKWKNFKTPMIRRGNVLSPSITCYSRHIPSFESMRELGRFHFVFF